jgi:hypothetical protein
VFGWFRRGLPVADQVRLDAAACARGLHAEVRAALGEGAAALLLLRAPGDLAAAAVALADCTPRVAEDHYALGELPRYLSAAGLLGIGLVDDLRAATAPPLRGAPLQVHVRGRASRRSEDQRLLDLLAPWRPLRVVFHHALDDALLREHAGRLRPLLQRLGLAADEAITSPLLTRALRRAQRA